METRNALGEFLRAHREQITPEEVGLGKGVGVRRVPGLRREEVAMLAGISSDYYLRLEQGRDRRPSVQVLDALARVLRLDADATAYMISLSQPSSRTATRPAATATTVPESVRHLLDELISPAIVQTRWLDVLAANRMALALSPNLAPGTNRLRAAFLDPAERAFHRDWPEAVARAVAGLRADAIGHGDDPQLATLVGELSLKSEEFRQLWARHDVRRPEGRFSLMRHPEVGDLDLFGDKLTIGGTDGLVLNVYHAEPGSESARSLALLGSLAAST
ncbi:helix-turn-helix protein [Asanoa ferruginea]|uniref:Helix-turn-helix protein n=1 Tax=Asanoa ferruginea TaxID=53367 RepID=A0A3D9ZXN5_9ACTN|nr:helix-turn-helix transcriptional regulator [Asanoa ferruginea]REG01957.1 helix-turn-helix protein [Asanoa ferruginea]GIF49934.1 transcriptional regulator [Asanoa ferruginea]